MLIDWFTVGAQALNFLILVWLMRHFLYGPILHAIDAREGKIAKELADAAAKQEQAQKDRDEFQRKNEAFDQQRAALLTEARDEADAERQRLIEEARKASDASSAARAEALREEARTLNQAIARRTQTEVFAITRKVLADLAHSSLEANMVEVFAARLHDMDGKAKEVLGAALKTAAEPALVRSAFDLPGEERGKIQNLLNETFASDIRLRFETAPDLVSGIELTTNGQKVSWSIADYLTSLEKGVGELLKQYDKPEPKPASKPIAGTGVAPEAGAQAPALAKPAAKAAPETKPAAKVIPGADHDVPDTAVPGANTGSGEALVPAASESAAKPGPATESRAKKGAEPKVATERVTRVEPADEPSADVAPNPNTGGPEKAEPESKAGIDKANFSGSAPEHSATTKAESISEAAPKASAEPPAPAKAVVEVKTELPPPQTEVAAEAGAETKPAKESSATPISS